MMQKRKFGSLLLIAKGIIGKWWTIIGNYKVRQQRELIRFLLLPAGIMGVLVIMLVVPLNYAPDTSVPFAYVPPPEEGYCIGSTFNDLEEIFLGYHADLDKAVTLYGGKTFIFKDIKISEYMLSGRTDTYIAFNRILLEPMDYSELKHLKEGDVIDVAGVCTGVPEGSWYVVIKNCLFLPAGLSVLPLPGGPAVISGY